MTSPAGPLASDPRLTCHLLCAIDRLHVSESIHDFQSHKAARPCSSNSNIHLLLQSSRVYAQQTTTPDEATRYQTTTNFLPPKPIPPPRSKYGFPTPRPPQGPPSQHAPNSLHAAPHIAVPESPAHPVRLRRPTNKNHKRLDA
jgi:hypothetical protein